MAAPMCFGVFLPAKRLILTNSCVLNRKFWCNVVVRPFGKSLKNSFCFTSSSMRFGTFRNCFQKGRSAERQWEIDTNIAKDTLLYEHDNTSFFRVVNFFALSQVVFWGYLAHFSYTTLRDAPPVPEMVQEIAVADDGESPVTAPQTRRWWQNINLGDNKYRLGITIMCCTIGYVILAGSTLFTMRAVKSITLLKGGQQVRMVCYSPWRSSRQLTIGVDNMSCHVAREHVKSYLPIKIKGYWMYFLLDKAGTYPDPKLFDNTAGSYRSWVQKK